MPDTLDGRFDLVGLHACLLIRRLRRLPPPGDALAQAVFDAMFSDMDINLREMGVGDMTVARNVRAMWEAFHGRATAYEAALDDPDPAALDGALARNVWRGGEATRAPRLAAIARRRVARLDRGPAAVAARGQVRFAARGSCRMTLPELAPGAAGPARRRPDADRSRPTRRSAPRSPAACSCPPSSRCVRLDAAAGPGRRGRGRRRRCGRDCTRNASCRWMRFPSPSPRVRRALRPGRAGERGGRRPGRAGRAAVSRAPCWSWARRRSSSWRSRWTHIRASPAPSCRTEAPERRQPVRALATLRARRSPVLAGARHVC